jgi:uncharacterized repeat protein (TIGR02543 family)
VAVSAVPNAGYAFTGWTASGVTLTSAASQAFVMPKNNVELTAAFEFIASSGPPPSLSTPPSSSSEPSPAPTPTPAPVEAGGEEAAAGTEGAAVTEGAAGTEVSAETEGAGEIRGETAPPDGTQNSETGSGSDGGMAGVAVPVTPSMPVAGYVPSAATGVKIVSAGVNYVVVVEGDLVYVFDESGTPLGYLRLQPGQTIEDLAEIDIAAELIPLPGARPNPKTGERAAAPFVIMFAVICSFAALTAKRGNATKRRG